MLFPGEFKPWVETLVTISELFGILKLPGFYTSNHTIMMYKKKVSNFFCTTYLDFGNSNNVAQEPES